MEKEFVSDTVQFLTDIIGDKYKEWTEGDLIFLKTPTGSGKTTFIVHTYATWLVQNRKNILILVSREILRQQLERELLKIYAQNVKDYKNFLTLIQIWTYQHLATQLSNYGSSSIPNFSAIVCDEAHFFLDDSIFNPDTGIVYEYVVERCDQMLSTLIVISATIECIQPFFLSDLPTKTKPTVAEAKPDINNIENSPSFQPSCQFFKPQYSYFANSLYF